MRVTRVRLSNFKCYDTASVSLRRGVTVIHGPNGAGKSSLLEAVFFALYGANALDVTLDDLVTRGADDAEVEVWFTHAGTDYRIERRVRATGERAQTATCVLETPEETVEGATAVRNAVVSLLRMDADAFVNCAYVRQGEVNKLINATPNERQAMLDDLLQLGTLERYRERAGNARLGVADVVTEARGQLNQLAAQVEEKEAKELHAELNELESELKEVSSSIGRYEEQREAAKERLAEAEEILEQHEERRAELDELVEAIEELDGRIAETEREREDLAERVSDRRERASELEADRDELAAGIDLEEVTDGRVSDRIDALEAERETLDDRRRELELERTEVEGDRETQRERASELTAEAEATREAAAELEAEVEAAESALAERREDLTALEEKREAAIEAFDDAPVEPGEAEAYLESLSDERESRRKDRVEVQADLETVRHQVAHAEGLLEEGKCPECGQTIEGAPRVEGLEADRERVAELEAGLESLDGELESLDARIEEAEALIETEREIERLAAQRESLEELLAEREAAVTEKRDRVEEHRERAEELESEAAERRDAAAEAEDRIEALEEQLTSIEDEREAVNARLDRLETLAERIEQLAAVEQAVERLREKRVALAELVEERRSTLADKRERRDELEAAFDADRIEEARAERERAEDYLQQVEPTLEELGERRDTLQGRVGAVENELEELESLRERQETLEERVDRLESLREEAATLEDLYGDLRAELRRQNIATLERLLNETFTLVYQNDAYARIELDEDYALTVYQKDGQPLEPDQLSGGERALFNLSLRTAIYRLLSEGIEGAAPMPPLILDEPTVFLDAGHVSQLVELVESMRELGVEQIIVVSHDEELIGAADALLTVSKDATSNRSSVEQGAQPEALAD